MATKKYMSLDRLQEYDALIKQEIVNSVSGKANSSHTHDDRYYTETEIDSKISTINNSISGKASSSHNHDTAYDAKGSANTALSSSKAYTDEKIANLLDNSTDAVDSIYELRDAMQDNADAIDALNAIASGKADKSHTHTIANVSGLQSALDGKAASSHGTHVSYSTTAPVMDGTASVGSATTVARSDHKHPTDTSRAAQTALDALTQTVSGKANTSHSHNAVTTSAAGFMTADMLTKLNGIASGANKTVVDSSLSTSSTNPVQNKLVTTALNNATTAINANTSSIGAHTTAISNLQTAVAEIQEITSEDIQNLFKS